MNVLVDFEFTLDAGEFIAITGRWARQTDRPTHTRRPAPQ